jgi:predicted ATP-grasp superfamily ATP-dependent carboligase
MVAPELIEEDSAALLLATANSIGTSSVLIPTHDLFVDLVSRHRDVLAPAFRFALPSPEALTVLRNKTRFAAEALRRGWSVPRSVSIQTHHELERAISELNFPVILKPALGTFTFRTRSALKAKLCQDPPELRAGYAEFSRWEAELIAQEFIPGGDDALEFSLHYHDSKLQELGGFTGRKLRQWPPLCGNTSFAEPADAPDLAAESRRILRELGCVGFGSVEYKRDCRSGRAYLIEPTAGRPDHQIGIALANGVDLVARAYASLTGVRLPEHAPPARPRKWIFLREDFWSALSYRRAGALSLSGYLGSLRGRLRGAMWRPGDWRLYPSLLRGFLALCYEVGRSRLRRYSVRSVRAGSTRVARRAGIPLATSTTTPSSKATSP